MFAEINQRENDWEVEGLLNILAGGVGISTFGHATSKHAPLNWGRSFGYVAAAIRLHVHFLGSP